MYLHDIFKELLTNVCFDASFTCLSWFVAFRVTFNDLCCWTKRCGLLSRLHLGVTAQTCQTGPKKFVSHFEVTFVVCWHQNEKLVQVVYITVSIILPIYTNFRHRLVYRWHWNKTSNWKIYIACICMISWKDCWQGFVWMLHLCVCLDLLHFVSLSTIYAIEHNFVVYCHTYI